MLVLNRSAESKEAPLKAARAAAKEQVIATADKVRRVYLTPITGQELTYKEKEDQADAFLLAETEPTEPGTEYCFIFGEVGITADTPRGVAEVVVYKAHLYRVYIGPAIERLRLLAEKNIAAATTTAEVDTALAEFLEDMEELT